jgi:hypothetical protein
MSDLVEKSAPTISSFGAAVTKGKIDGNAMDAEEIIAGIIRGWRHLVGAKLVQELSEFAVGVARASAHLIVSWIAEEDEEKRKKRGGGDKGFTLPTDILGYLSNLDRLNREKDFEKDKGRGTLRRKTPVAKPRTT